MTLTTGNASIKGIKQKAFAVRDVEAALHKPLISLNFVFVGALNRPAREVRHDYRH